MPTKKQIQPGEKVPFKLTATERKLVLEDLMCLDQEHEQVIRDTPAGKPVMLTLDDLEDFSGYITLARATGGDANIHSMAIDWQSRARITAERASTHSRLRHLSFHEVIWHTVSDGRTR